MNRIGVFVDVSNLYYCCANKFSGGKVNYKAYLDYVRELGDVTQATAYGAQIGDEAAQFIHALVKCGYTPKYKEPKTFSSGENIRRKADWDVGIAIDIVKMMDRLDIIVLGSADGDLTSVVEWAVEKGIKVIVLACCISTDLKLAATEFIEIPESMIESKK